MRLLAITSVFPNSLLPKYAPYTWQQCEALSKRCDLEIFATIPWFPMPSQLARFNYWGRDLGPVPSQETLLGLDVQHPRVLRIPKLGFSIAAATYAASIAPRVRRLRPDAILATWAYPDGAAALLLGSALGIPTFVQVIGSDLNIVAKKASARAQLRSLLPRAAGAIAVSAPLARELTVLGAKRVEVIRTGVNTRVFCPRSRADARERLGVNAQAKLVLFVGRLHKEKGLAELLDALEHLVAGPNSAELVVVGEGPYRRELERRGAKLGARLRLTGEVGLEGVADWIAACDVLALPSYGEGTPNVVIEALSSGRKVVATDVGGIPDLVTLPIQGELVPPKDVQHLAEALGRVLSQPYDETEVASSIEAFDWDENARRVLSLIESCA
ncbi:MAG: hypothetical protein RJA70_1296 [Pseudomonadota bacterium]|jgi:glycosyltransferase involved in cell wall biosynthesis